MQNQARHSEEFPDQAAPATATRFSSSLPPGTEARDALVEQLLESHEARKREGVGTARLSRAQVALFDEAELSALLDELRKEVNHLCETNRCGMRNRAPRVDETPPLDFAATSTNSNPELTTSQKPMRARHGKSESGNRAVTLIFLNRYFYPDHSATSQLLTDLAFHLADRGWKLQVITSRLRYEDADTLSTSREFVHGIQVHRVWTSRFGRATLLGRAVDYLTFYSSAAWRLWWIARKGDLVIAKTDPPLVSVPAAMITKLRGAHLVNWLQDVFPEVAQNLGVRITQGFIGDLTRRLRDWSLRTAVTNVVLGKRMAAVVSANCDCGDSVQVIANWADGEKVYPVANHQNDLRSKWGLQSQFVVGYSGNMGRAHDFETFLSAAEQLRDRTDISFLWIGNGAHRDMLESEATRRDLKSFQFQPYQKREQLAESLSVADVHLASLVPELEGLIVPSKFYGIAAAGRPTLFVGDIDGEIASLIRDNRCGFSVARGDSEALADHILELAANQELCRAMGERARVLFDLRFDKQVSLAKWERTLTAAVAHTREAATLPAVATTG